MGVLDDIRHAAFDLRQTIRRKPSGS